VVDGKSLSTGMPSLEKLSVTVTFKRMTFKITKELFTIFCIVVTLTFDLKI